MRMSNSESLSISPGVKINSHLSNKFKAIKNVTSLLMIKQAFLSGQTPLLEAVNLQIDPNIS